MSMKSKIVHFDPDIHMDDFEKIYLEYGEQFFNDFKEFTGKSFRGLEGATASDFVRETMESYISLKYLHGVLFVIEVEEELAAIGGIHKLSDDTGEIKRMFTRPKFRRNGFARKMLNELLEKGRSLGCKRFLLDTPLFFEPAHALYRSAGFVEEYPESEVPVDWRQYWMFMELKA
jgi:GNAT superfamily N-acetyltransferase